MSQAAGAPSTWMRHDGPGSARERLRTAVAALTRARRLQVLVDHGFGGLLAGLGLATVAVLLARLLPSPYAPWQLASAAVIIALAVALPVGWRRRPGALEVAIRADLMLRLKQRLSTAWEYVTIHGDNALADRLAVHAVKAGLPARPWRVFPLRVNRWGLLSPLAATALLLVSVVDVSRVPGPLPRNVDEQVVAEGQRLGAFGRAMQARAERDKLPRSTRQAAKIERLGARMESGALSRSQALEQLRQRGESLDQERMQAQASQTGAGLQRAESAEGSPIAPHLNAGAMLERMQRGALDSDDTRALAQRLSDIERSGIARQELENALGRHRAGVDDALREILEKLAQIERALKEDRELRNAREQVRRARENLADSRAGASAGRGRTAILDWDDDEGEDRGDKGEANAGAVRRLDSATAGKSSSGASLGDSSIAADRQHSPLRPDSRPSGPVLAPQGQMRDGEVFTSQEGWILPRPGRPRVENVEMSSEFASQVEEVLSREQYPAHYKEFIRRYFLTLSQGVRVPQEQSPGTRVAP